MSELGKILIMLIPTLLASLYGGAVIFRSSKSLFCRMPALAFICLLAGQLSYLVAYLSGNAGNNVFQIGFLGPLGSALFFLCANNGSVASFFDDGSEEMKKSRFLGLLAPAAVILLFMAFVAYWRSSGSEDFLPATIIYGLFTLVTCIAIYYTFKNVLLPDVENGYIDCMRPYHVVITLLLLMWNVERGVRFIYPETALEQGLIWAFYGILAVLTLAALPLLERGRKKCLK